MLQLKGKQHDMNLQEFQRLRALSYATKMQSSFRPIKYRSKRQVRANGKAIGQILKTSRIEYQVRAD